MECGKRFMVNREVLFLWGLAGSGLTVSDLYGNRTWGFFLSLLLHLHKHGT